MNPTARSVFGETPDLVGRDFDEIIHILWPPAYADEVVRLFRHTLTTGDPYSTPLRIEQRRDRCMTEYYEWQINRILLPDGRHGVVCYFRDISAHVQARQALMQQRAELETMLNLIPVGVAIAHDRQGDHITVSPGFAKELGLLATQNASSSGPDRDQIPYRHLRDGKIIPPEELPLQRAARTGVEVRDDELDVELADGRVLNLMVSAAPLFDGQGHPRGAIGAAVNVTALKQVQRDLQTAHQHKDEFLAMLAHELRNPLAPIRNAGELLSRTDADPIHTAEAIRILKRQVGHLTRLVDDLLDVSRINQGRIDLRREPVQLSEVIAQAVETVEPLLRGKRQKLSITSAGPLRVEGDSARLVQCVANLLTNAVKYTDVEGRIHIESLEDAPDAVLRVTDTGAGISPELLPHLFDLFVQGRRTLDRAEGGLGIGLSVVKQLVHMHRGRVSAMSRGVGSGATFEIRLPLMEQSAAEPAERRALRAPPRRILIVDDNADAAQSLAMVLSLDGHEVRAVSTGQEALDQFSPFRPDLVLLDLGLPGMDGYEVARKLRAQPAGPAVRLVALTGYGQAEDKHRTAAAGFDDHLIKPVEFSLLAHTLAVMPSVPSLR